MENFFSKNSKWIIFVLFILFSIKSFQSCIRKTNINRIKKTLTYEMDSLLNQKDIIIDSLEWEIEIKDNKIQEFYYELKIAGVKVDAAEQKAEAVQRTAEKIKTNTTIKIEQQKNDTIN